MINKPLFWIITDENVIFEEGWSLWKYLYSTENRQKYPEKVVKYAEKYLEYKVIRKPLQKVLEIDGSPDYIIIDMSCIEEYKFLEKLTEKHSSSIIRIVSYVSNYIKIHLDEMKEYVKYNIFETGYNGNEALSQYIIEKILEHYPYE